MTGLTDFEIQKLSRFFKILINIDKRRKMNYKFSPIKNDQELRNAICYVAEQTSKLCYQITGQEYPIEYLTIFSHFEDEFDTLRKIVEPLGEIIEANNGYAVKLEKPIQLKNNELYRVRIRKPDPERPQVGCNDFAVPDYGTFKNTYLQIKPNNLRLINRPEYDMIEFFDPNFDVLAYVITK
jgi:hypothetical protein